MSLTQQLARPDILRLDSYRPACLGNDHEVRLHANEVPWCYDWDNSFAGLNRYPDPQAPALTSRLAALYDVPEECVLATRGSDDAIDALVRVFCRPEQDAVLVTPPGFSMYAVAAGIQGARVISTPLGDAPKFALPVDQVIADAQQGVKLVFLCTPNNPTGNEIDSSQIETLCTALAQRAYVVVDEAYIEFSSNDSVSTLLPRFPNLVVLRTLSKAYALAGARCGAVLAEKEVLSLLRRVLPPYLLPAPTQAVAEHALSANALAETRQRIVGLLAARSELSDRLGALPCVRQVFSSAANFLLVSFDDPAAVLVHARQAGLLLRDCRGQPGLESCLRISVGSPTQNNRLCKALANIPVCAA